MVPVLETQNNPTTPAVGQIWSLDSSRLGGWGPYERYYTPPIVLLLQFQDNGTTARVAQICSEVSLQGDDNADIWLCDSIGFAESWNVFSVHRDDLMACRGEVDKSIAGQVLEQSNSIKQESALSPAIRQFRELEVQVGAFMAMQAMQQVMAEVERVTVEERELIPGLKVAFTGAKDFVLDIVGGTLDRLRDEYVPSMVLRGEETQSSQKLTDEQKNALRENCPVVPVDIQIADNTLTVKLKWLQEKQVVAPVVNVVFNGIALSEIQVNDGAKDTVIIKCSHELIRNKVQNLSTLKFVVNEFKLLVIINS
jgi:hypothetical protein